RLLVSPGSLEDLVVRKMSPPRSLDIFRSPVQNHCVLNLPTSYDEFFQVLGKQTRRNFRYYRRRSESAGQSYVESVPLAEFSAAAFRLLERNVVGAKRTGLVRALGMLACARRPLLIGIRAAGGEWVSVLGGWYEQNRAVVFCQMNNEQDHP